jgi:hypothetical protein
MRVSADLRQKRKKVIGLGCLSHVGVCATWMQRGEYNSSLPVSYNMHIIKEEGA